MAGHDEFPTLGLLYDEMLVTVLHRGLLVGAGFERLLWCRLVGEMGAQAFEEIGVELLPDIERAKADAFLILQHMGDALGGGTDDSEGESPADSEGEAGEGGDLAPGQ